MSWPGARLSVRADLLEIASLGVLLDTDLVRGLDHERADEISARWGPNELAPPDPDPLTRRLARHLFEPMSLLLIAAAGVSGVVLEERVDAVAILAIVVLNTTIAFVQEGRAARALEALKSLETPVASVLRDGYLEEIPAHGLVIGDVIVLRPGVRVPADARLIEADALEADESLLTGESVPVAKSPTTTPPSAAGIAERHSMVFTGSLITRGSGRAIVVATGMGSELGAIAGGLQQRTRPTPLQRQLRTLAFRIGAATVVAALVVVALLILRGGGAGAIVQRAFLVGVALAVAAVPEGLAAVTTVTLALGVKRMADRGGIVRRLPAVETLGATTVLAIDKTGTLTENRMTLARFVDPWGERVDLGTPGPVRDAFAEVASLCSDATLDPATGDPLEIALLEAAGSATVEPLRRGFPRVTSRPFDAERKRMTTVHRTEAGFVVLAKGAPEAIIDRCSAALAVDGSPVGVDRELVGNVASDLATAGYRVIALARRHGATASADEDGLVLVGLAALEDPVRSEAAGAVTDARGAGLQIAMVTGDHPATATTVARQVGLVDAGADIRTGADLRQSGVPIDPAAIAVYARVDPDQKLAIVERLQRNGHVVAVTGDGVNDAPALRRADIGVALGRSGTDVAKEASDLVLTDDNLATMVAAIREGRSIYANIRKVVNYLLACNLSEVLTVLLALVAFPAVGVPLLPLQLLWMNIVTDGLPALALGVDPADDSLMRAAPRPRNEALVDGRVALTLLLRGLVMSVVAIIGLVVVRYVIGHPWADARGAMFTVLVWTQLLHVFSARQRHSSIWGRVSPVNLVRSIAANRRLAAAVAAGASLQALIVAWGPAGTVFGTRPFAAGEWVLAAGLAALGALCVAALPSLHRSGV